ncbi:MAG: hypothetical protein ABFS45_12595 [Pseudomonadota bacterium]
MKNTLLKRILYTVFTAVNTALLYLFLLQLPFGVDALSFSLRHWSKFSPRIEFAAIISIAIAITTLILVRYLDGEWKSRLVYFRHQFAQPGYRAFFGGRDPGFDRRPLEKAYPEVRDSAYNPQVQLRVWTRLYKKHANASLVIGTYHSWVLLRDLYLISLVFLIAFLLAWPLNFGVPAVLVLSYIFIFGAQFLFLMFSARGTGSRLECNVLAEALAIKPAAARKVKKRKATGR